MGDEFFFEWVYLKDKNGFYGLIWGISYCNLLNKKF